MKRLLIFLVVIGALFLYGCEDMFTFNLFDGMGQPEFPESAEEFTNIIAETEGDTGGLLAAVTDMTSSSAFYDNLDEMTPETKAEVLEAITSELTAVFTNTDESQVSKEERAEAAILTAEIYLNSNDDAKQVVDEFMAPVFDTLSDPDASFEEAFADMDVETVMNDVLENAFGGAENLELALDALSGAADAYTAFGFTLPDPDAEATAMSRGAVAMEIEFDEHGIPDNIGELVQNALVAIGVTTFMEYYELYTGDTVSSIDEILYAVNEDNINLPANPENPDGPTYGDIIVDTVNDLMENEAFLRILEAAEIGALLGGDGSGNGDA